MVQSIIETFIDMISLSSKNLSTLIQKISFYDKRTLTSGYTISKMGIEVDRAKVEPPISVKGLMTFLGHVGSYIRFIYDFSTKEWLNDL